MEDDDIMRAVKDVLGNEYATLVVESGSKAWGFASPDSDYDVRCVYIGSRRDYLTLWDRRATKEGFRGDVDVVGWDLAKFLRLMHKSNPSVYEWLGSPITYYEGYEFEDVREMAKRCFDPISSAWHHYNVAKDTAKAHTMRDTVRPKKYLYVIRGILAARWSLEERTPVPVPFDELLGAMLPSWLENPVTGLLEVKMTTTEGYRIDHIEPLDEWIWSELLEIEPFLHGEHRNDLPTPDEMDELFQKMVEGPFYEA